MQIAQVEQAASDDASWPMRRGENGSRPVVSVLNPAHQRSNRSNSTSSNRTELLRWISPMAPSAAIVPGMPRYSMDLPTQPPYMVTIASAIVLLPVPPCPTSQ